MKDYQLKFGFAKKQVAKPPLRHVPKLLSDCYHYGCITRPSRQMDLVESIRHKISHGDRDDIRLDEMAMLYAAKDLVREEKIREIKGDRSYLFRDSRRFSGATYTNDWIKYHQKLAAIRKRRETSI